MLIDEKNATFERAEWSRLTSWSPATEDAKTGCDRSQQQDGRWLWHRGLLELERVDRYSFLAYGTDLNGIKQLVCEADETGAC